jgi:hypothetical protein
MRKSKGAKLISMFLIGCLLTLGVVIGASSDADAQRRARLRRVGTGAAVGAGAGAAVGGGRGARVGAPAGAAAGAIHHHRRSRRRR